MQTQQKQETEVILAMAKKIKAYETFVTNLGLAADLDDTVTIRKLLMNAQIANQTRSYGELLRLD